MPGASTSTGGPRQASGAALEREEATPEEGSTTCSAVGGGRARRFGRRVLLVLFVHLITTAAGRNVLDELYVYAALVSIGILPLPLPRPTGQMAAPPT